MKKTIIIFAFFFLLFSCNIPAYARTTSDKPLILADSNKDSKSKNAKDKSSLKNNMHVSIEPSHSEITQGNEDKLYDEGNKLMQVVRNIVTGVIGLIDIIAVGVVLCRLYLLASSSGDPMARKNAIKGLSMSFLMVALLGSITVLYALIYNSLR